MEENIFVSIIMEKPMNGLFSESETFGTISDGKAWILEKLEDLSYALLSDNQENDMNNETGGIFSENLDVRMCMTDLSDITYYVKYKGKRIATLFYKNCE